MRIFFTSEYQSVIIKPRWTSNHERRIISWPLRKLKRKLPRKLPRRRRRSSFFLHPFLGKPSVDTEGFLFCRKPGGFHSKTPQHRNRTTHLFSHMLSYRQLRKFNWWKEKQTMSCCSKKCCTKKASKKAPAKKTAKKKK